MDLTTARVTIGYATMAQLNKVRAWARKNNARVQTSRYARDAYEGHVIIPSPWNEGREQHEQRIKACQELLQTLGIRSR